MAELVINDTIYKAKTGYKFKNTADEKYSTKEDDGKGNTVDIDGFTSIYLKILQYDLDALVEFWDCALSHRKDRPKIEDIQDAIDERVEQDGDIEPTFQEAFQVLDQSGFFKKAAKQIRDGLLQQVTAKENETEEQKEQREQAEEVNKIMLERYEELAGQSLNK